MVPSPCQHAGLHRWVAEAADLCRPAAIHWCDGSAAERDRLNALLVRSGTFIPLDPRRHPGSFLARTHPSDVARVEERTFIACRRGEDAGPTNHWRDPDELRRTLRGLFAGCMAGRTLYVVPFAMGVPGSPACRIGVELTDSPYVVVSMRIMARIGGAVLDRLGRDGEFIPCLHSVGVPLAPGQADEPWPCAPLERKHIAHFPETREIWSFGSGYGGNALLGKKCLALRIASVLGRDEGWMAEHMLILALTSPAGRTHYIAAAFPSACGKTNLAMMTPALPGWTVRCLGDDIAWMRPGPDGRLWACNPEAGFFGVAPGTSARTNPAALATVSHDAIFTNTALTPDGGVWWEGMGVPAPAQATDWEGRAWTPDCGRRAAHPNARFTAPAANCPVIDARWDDPAGVPISAILFGGRRPRTIPLVCEARDWRHGVFLGASIASETTAAAAGAVGAVRRDPFAMLPFCGYHMGDYWAHWLAMGERLGDAAPRLFTVNWFRTDEQGRFLWPGFGDNARVLAWVVDRLEGRAAGRSTPIGILPAAGEVDIAGLSLAPGALDELLRLDRAGWRREADDIAALHARLGDRLPPAMTAELAALRRGLEA